MSVKAIADRYATALLNEAVAQGREDTVEQELAMVQSTANASADLRVLLRSPIIEWWRKKAIMQEIFAQKLSPLTMSFLDLVIEKGRERFYRDIISSYGAQLDQRRNVVRVQIDSAVELDDSARERVQKALAAKTGKTVAATYGVDAALLGGMRVTIGDNVYDGSLRHQLEDLKASLAAEVLNEQ